MSSIGRLPLRFKDDGTGHCEGIMPSECRKDMNCFGLFECRSGEIVKVKWKAVTNNTSGNSDKVLDRITQRIYGMPFARIRSEWIGRLGDIEGWWDYIVMEKV